MFSGFLFLFGKIFRATFEHVIPNALFKQGDALFSDSQFKQAAETYARLTMDKDLHDKLLKEVVDFKLTGAPDSALSNQIAKRRAKRLLADGYFAE